MKKILVMGGAGYIGSHTLKHLRVNGYDCVVADNLSTGKRDAVLGCDLEIADLMDTASLEKVFSKYDIDAVIHFAAFIQVGESVLNPEKYYYNNVVGTLNLLSVMLKHNVKKIVFSSSAATYGNPEYLPIDENHPQNPINPYGQTKLMMEKIFADYHRAYGLKYIALRYFNACGCDLDGELGSTALQNLIPIVMNVFAGKADKLKIFGDDYKTPDGTCLRDYIHVSDLANAHRLALEKLDTFSGAINLGTSKATSVKEIVDMSENIIGKKCLLEIVPRREGDPEELYASNDMAKNILGWTPYITSLRDIISSTWNWEKNRKF